MNCTRPIFFLFLLLGKAATGFSQVSTDTIYYDYDWSICEKQLARFYRVGELHATSEAAYFTGNIRDFYQNGQLEMEGHYNAAGKKDGTFTFYYQNGKRRAIAGFRNDTAAGLWSYFNSDGQLHFQLKLNGASDFIPFFILNAAGDTLVKQGTGKFTISTADFPEVFDYQGARAPSYIIQGSCNGGRKEDKWKISLPSTPTYVEEHYLEGRYVKGKWIYGNKTSDRLEKPVDWVKANTFLPKFYDTEIFARNHVFSANGAENASEALFRFLFDGQIPFIVSKSTSFENNVADYIRQVNASITREKINLGEIRWVNEMAEVPVGFTSEAAVLKYLIQTDQKKYGDNYGTMPIIPVPKINLEIAYTLEPEGQLSNIMAKGNLDKDDLAHLTYYLSCLSNLVPKMVDGKPVAAPGKMYLFTKQNKVVWKGRPFVVYRLVFSTKVEEETKDNFSEKSFHLSKKGAMLPITLSPIL